MDKKQEIISSAILLTEAIEKNEIELTQTLVDYLNNNFELLDDFSCLTEIIPLYSMSNDLKYITDAFLYTIDNLNYIKDIQKLKWNTNATLSISDLDKKNFILNFINSTDTIESYQMPFLIQSCMIINDYELLNQIKTKFNKNFLNGEEK